MKAKPDMPVRSPTWADEVVALFMRDPDMETAEFDALYEVALTGRRPEHPGLPAYLPFLQGG